MKKTIVQIKDIEWYETNKNDHGIVYKDINDDTDFFSRGQSIYCGKISEVISIDNFGNYKLKIDNGEWIFRSWMLSSEKEEDITDEIIDAVFTDETMEEIINNIPLEERIDKITSDKIDKQSEAFKIQIINEINSWNLGFNLGLVAMNIISADKSNIENYKSLMELSITCLKNELENLKKEK